MEILDLGWLVFTNICIELYITDHIHHLSISLKTELCKAVGNKVLEGKTVNDY